MSPEPIVGVILAGGRAQRMGGGDKALQVLGGRPLLARIVDRMRPQCPTLLLNAGGDRSRFADFPLPVIPDPVSGQPGPLAGVLAGLDWAATQAPGTELIVTVPGDAPFLPGDLVRRLQQARADQNAIVALASSRDRLHPVIGLWPVALRQELRAALEDEGLRKVEAWARRFPLAVVPWPAEPIDPFFNINRPEDLGVAEALLAQAP